MTSAGCGSRWIGKAVNAELHSWRDFRQCGVCALAARKTVGNDTDLMAAAGLAVCQIEDVANNSADRCAHRMENPQRLILVASHDQNQRSLTRTVSPGLSGVPSGTTVRTGPAASACVRVTLSRRARAEKPPAMATALSTLRFGT